MININMECAVIADDYMFFSALDFNALFKMNLMSGKTEYVCKFEKEKVKSNLHVKAFRYEKQIWFIPLCGEYIACFHEEKNKIDYLDIPKKAVGKMGVDEFWFHTCAGTIRPKFLDSGKVDDEKLYLVPTTSDAVIILNMKTGNIKPYYGVVNVKQEFIGSGTMCGDKLWMAPYIGKQLIGLDIKTGDIDRIECPYELGIYFRMCSFANKLWFSPQNEKKGITYDTVLNKFEQIDIENEQSKDTMQVCRYMYRDVVLFHENIWFLPTNTETIICMDPITGNSLKFYPPENGDFGIVVGLEIYKDKLFLLSYNYGYLMSIDRNKNLTIFKRASIDEDEFYRIRNGELLREYYHQFTNIIPEEKLGLQNYIRIRINEQGRTGLKGDRRVNEASRFYK